VAALVAKNIEKQIMLAGFQISHSDGLKASSHNHHIFYVQLSTSTESMLLSLLSAPAFTAYCDGALYQKCYLTDRSDVILRSQNVEKSRFSGASLRTPPGEA